MSERTPIEAAWEFSVRNIKVRAKIHYPSRTYTIEPGDKRGSLDSSCGALKGGDEGFTFKCQTATGSFTREVAQLIDEAARFCEDTLLNLAAEILKPAKNGAPTWKKDENSNALENLPCDQHPAILKGPDGEMLMRSAVYKSGTMDAARALLGENKPPMANLKDFLRGTQGEAAAEAPSLVERLFAKERAATVEVGIQGSDSKIEVPGVVDYGAAPAPLEERSDPTFDHVPDPAAPPKMGETFTEDYGPADGQYELDAAESAEERVI